VKDDECFFLEVSPHDATEIISLEGAQHEFIARQSKSAAEVLVFAVMEGLEAGRGTESLYHRLLPCGEVLREN
jgi:hypothetical protein